MTSPPAFSASVLLAAADAASVDLLQPAAVMLASFGIETSTAVLCHDAPMPPMAAGVCAVIVASPDALLPAALSAQTALPVIRVPVESIGRGGMALLTDSTGNLPAAPGDGAFGTMAIGEAGAKNAALFVVSALATTDERLRAAWSAFRTRQTEAVLRHPALEPKE